MRQLIPALAASTALHVAVLAAAASGRSPPSPTPSPAAVELEIFTSNPGRVGLPVRVAPPVVVPRASPRPVARRHGPVPPPTAAVDPISEPERVIAPPVPSEVAPAARVANAATPPAVEAQPERASERSGDLDLFAFFQRLQRAAQLCSGPRAGEGKVRFCVGRDGSPTDISLVQSTGNFALDDAALHCVIPGAAPFPRTDRCLVVPLRFQ